MEDKRIVELYWERSEQAIAESERKYGTYCHYIANNILSNNEDAQECVNDTWLGAWHAMPPHKPIKLAAFLGKITRNLALNRRERTMAEKRGGGEIPLVLDELAECVPDTASADLTEEIALRQALNAFLRALPEETMIIFLQRYFYCASVRDIAKSRAISENRIKVTLHRARNKLKLFLEKEGIVL
ncbi:MAG: sigma-70 family RNA polymerase sigma factor [Ruminococcaceae bacterium]|nr:sigma-70 family RNA polymerase sigma factor [Oscillospiraceae bacterium]